MDMKRIALGVQYDGTGWKGWQTQPTRDTVQDALEAAMEKFAQTRLITTCAGRTDAGVHALEQVVHFDTEIERDMNAWVRGVNSHLPKSVAVRWAHSLPTIEGLEFHARFSARSRTYRYMLYNHAVRSPILKGRVGWVFRPLDLTLMRQAALHLMGTHDFSAFRSAECQATSPIKDMQWIDIQRYGDMVVFSLRASAFLHHMVRNIVGCLVFVGTGNRPTDWLKEVLESRNRKYAAPTFMPDGLYLDKIEYDPAWQLPQEDTHLFCL